MAEPDRLSPPARVLPQETTRWILAARGRCSPGRGAASPGGPGPELVYEIDSTGYGKVLTDGQVGVFTQIRCDRAWWSGVVGEPVGPGECPPERSWGSVVCTTVPAGLDTVIACSLAELVAIDRQIMPVRRSATRW